MIHNPFFYLPVAYGLKEFGVSIGPIVRDDVRCNGSESKLTNCPADHNHDCWIIETAGVNCCGAPGMNQQATINSSEINSNLNDIHDGCSCYPLGNS